MDKDGRFEYSTIVSLENESGIVTIHPNPASSVLYINSSKEMQLLEVHDGLGRLITKLTVAGNTFNLPLENYAQGVYYVRVSLDGATVVNRKFLKE
jgi:hypothetical protein